MNEYYVTLLILWLWIICSWSALQTFSEVFPDEWSNYNILTKVIAFIFGPILLTIVLFLPNKSEKE